MHHCSTVQQRGQLVSQLLADARQHGLVSQLSRDHQVSRQTLYRWKAKVEEAIQEALSSDTTKSGHPAGRLDFIRRGTWKLSWDSDLYEGTLRRRHES
jgi:hypothetical protein